MAGYGKKAPKAGKGKAPKVTQFQAAKKKADAKAQDEAVAAKDTSLVTTKE